MRTIERVGASICLLLVLIALASRQLASIQSFRQTPPDIWQFLHAGRDGYSSRGKALNATLASLNSTASVKLHKRPSMDDLAPGRAYRLTPAEELLSTQIHGEKKDGVIVIGKMSNEDTSWVRKELPEWQEAIYTVDAPSSPDSSSKLRVQKNKGKEANAYLQYIIDHYDSLPQTIVFLHAHKDGYPQAWHTEFSEHSNVATIRMLQTDFVQRNGYANLRCNPTPGCPAELRPAKKAKTTTTKLGGSGSGNDDDDGEPGKKETEQAYADAWKVFFGNSYVPETVGAACCAQFAVSRDQVLKRDLASYQRFHRWLMETELSDDTSGRVMEYMWHIIFGMEPVYCPDLMQCYSDVYGI